MILSATTSSSVIPDVGGIANAIFGDFSPAALLICALLFTVMIAGVLVKVAGGEHVDFGLDDDELNPLE